MRGVHTKNVLQIIDLHNIHNYLGKTSDSEKGFAHSVSNQSCTNQKLPKPISTLAYRNTRTPLDEKTSTHFLMNLRTRKNILSFVQFLSHGESDQNVTR